VRILAVLLSIAVSSMAPMASAQDDDARCLLEGPSDDEVRERLAVARTAIGHHEPDMRHWYTAFLVMHGVMGGVQIALFIAAADDDQRADFGFQALSSVLGMATLLISTPPLLGAGGTLDAMPESTEEERRIKLVSAESLMRRSSDAVSFVRGPVSSLLTTGYGLAASAVLLLAFERPTAALTLAAGTALLGQGRLLLHPWGIRDAWTAYRRRYENAGCPFDVPARPVVSSWNFSTYGIGLSFNLTF
jgi:hypothetical protein